MTPVKVVIKAPQLNSRLPFTKPADTGDARRAIRRTGFALATIGNLDRAAINPASRTAGTDHHGRRLILPGMSGTRNRLSAGGVPVDRVLPGTCSSMSSSTPSLWGLNLLDALGPCRRRPFLVVLGDLADPLGGASASSCTGSRCCRSGAFRRSGRPRVKSCWRRKATGHEHDRQQHATDVLRRSPVTRVAAGCPQHKGNPRLSICRCRCAVIIPILWVINLSTSTRLWAHWPTFGWGSGWSCKSADGLCRPLLLWTRGQKKVDEIMAREKLRVVSGEKQLMQAQMRMLQAQIEPRFVVQHAGQHPEPSDQPFARPRQSDDGQLHATGKVFQQAVLGRARCRKLSAAAAPPRAHQDPHGRAAAVRVRPSIPRWNPHPWRRCCCSRWSRTPSSMDWNRRSRAAAWMCVSPGTGCGRRAAAQMWLTVRDNGLGFGEHADSAGTGVGLQQFARTARRALRWPRDADCRRRRQPGHRHHHQRAAVEAAVPRPALTGHHDGGHKRPTAFL